MALADDLIAHWKLNEASGARADSHGSFNLTDNNTVTSRAMVLNDGASFDDANNEYLSHADHADLSFPTGDMTLVFWVRLDDLSAAKALVTKVNWGANQKEYYTRVSTTRFMFRASSNGTGVTDVVADSFGLPSTGVDYMIFAYHKDGVEIGISINDGTVDTIAFTGGMYAGTARFTIGRLDDDLNRMDGGIDSVSIWSRKLTAAEVTALYNGGAGLDYPFPTYDQEGFRFRNDDGSESGASWLATQDVNITRGKNVNTRLRVLADVAGNTPTQQAALQYRKVGDADSEWRDVP